MPGHEAQDEELNQNQEMGCLLSAPPIICPQPFSILSPDPGQTRRNDRCKNGGRLENKYKIPNIMVPNSQANCVLLLFLLWVSVGHDWGEFARTSHNLRFEMLPSLTCVILIFETIFSIHTELYVFPIHARSPWALVTDFIAIKSLLSSWGIKLCGILK